MSNKHFKVFYFDFNFSRIIQTKNRQLIIRQLIVKIFEFKVFLENKDREQGSSDNKKFFVFVLQ